MTYRIEIPAVVFINVEAESEDEAFEKANEYREERSCDELVSDRQCEEEIVCMFWMSDPPQMYVTDVY